MPPIPPPKKSLSPNQQEIPQQPPASDQVSADQQGSKPDVRLAVTVAYGATSPDQMGRALRSPSVRLVAHSAQGKQVNDALSSPSVRLGLMPNQGGESDKNALALSQEAPNVRLAHVPGAQGDNVLLGQRGVEPLPPDCLPALLVSYYYLEQFERNRHRYYYRDWVMDSGAFSAHNSGVEIRLQDYIDCCKRLIEQDPTLTEIYALDVIGDWKASLKNAEEMWRQGVPAIPCFHYGEPWDLLKGLAKDYPKIALGGCVGRRDKDKFVAQCFARIWPKKVHGFGFGSEKSIMMHPFHSVDATNWEIAPCKYGTWKSFGGQRVSVRGSSQNLRVEVEWYLELERKARLRWKKEMELLESVSPTLRLGMSSKTHLKKQEDCRIDQALKAPTVRLVGNGDVVCERQIQAFSQPYEKPTAPAVRLTAANDGGAIIQKGKVKGLTPRGVKPNLE